MTTSVGHESAGASGSARPLVRAGSAGDAFAAARLHARHIPTGFLSLLGPSLLARLYRRVARSHDCFLLVAEGDGKTVGFLAGSLDTRGLFRRFVVLDGPLVALTTGWALVRHWRQALETLLGARIRQPGVEPNTHGVAAGVEAELLSVAVDDEYRGAGLGSALTRQFLAEAARRGAGSARVVVGATNDDAVKVYVRCGFAAVEQFEHHRGTASLLMRCRLVPPSAVQDRSGPVAPA